MEAGEEGEARRGEGMGRGSRGRWRSPLRGSFLDSDLQVSSPSRCGRVAGRVPWEGVEEEWGGERVDGSVGVSSAGLFPGFGPPGELTLSGWVEAGGHKENFAMPFAGITTQHPTTLERKVRRRDHHTTPHGGSGPSSSC